MGWIEVEPACDNASHPVFADHEIRSVAKGTVMASTNAILSKYVSAGGGSAPARLASSNSLGSTKNARSGPPATLLRLQIWLVSTGYDQTLLWPRGRLYWKRSI